MIANSNFIAFSAVLHLKVSFVASLLCSILKKVQWGNIISFAIQLFAYGCMCLCQKILLCMYLLKPSLHTSSIAA